MIKWRGHSILLKFARLFGQAKTKPTRFILQKAGEANQRETFQIIRRKLPTLDVLNFPLQLNNRLPPILWDKLNLLGFGRSKTKEWLNTQS